MGVIFYIFKKIAILGFAFKPDTNDTRESPAIYVCKHLIEEKAKLFIHDPEALDNARKDLQGIDSSVTYTENLHEAISDAHAKVILTQWRAYAGIDFKRAYTEMQKRAFIFDGRGILDRDALLEVGFNVVQLGVATRLHF